MELQHIECRGQRISSYIDDLGGLRIQVFAEWPYLYQGDLSYERNYLKTYQNSENSLVYMIYDGPVLVGATTAILLKDESAEFQRPFQAKDIPPARVLYFGESLLLPAYRGRGLGKLFMEKRLKFAQEFPEVQWAAFCAVQRDPKDPRRPESHRPLDEFWKSFGFEPQKDMLTSFDWKDLGEQKTSPKTLMFWLKKIR